MANDITRIIYLFAAKLRIKFGITKRFSENLNIFSIKCQQLADTITPKYAKKSMVVWNTYKRLKCLK
jgi:hypothetical protein